MANARVTEADEDVQEVADEEELVPDPEAALSVPTAGHAVWLYSINMGSGNESDQQVQALFAPRYQLARRGISFATSPRHANVVLLTGTLTRTALAAVQGTLAAVPDPHAIIAVGDGALDGGVFAGSEEIVPNAAELLGVNVEISGDPPTPVQILRAIEEAARLLDAAETGGEDETAEAEAEEDSEAADAEDDGEIADEDVVEEDEEP